MKAIHKPKHPLSLLQQTFLQELVKAFPMETKQLLYDNNSNEAPTLSFHINAPNAEFGKLSFVIEKEGIAIQSPYDQKFYEVSLEGLNKYEKRKEVKSICAAAIKYLTAFFNGNMIIEFRIKGKKVMAARQFNKNKADQTEAVTIGLSKYQPNRLIKQWRSLFRKSSTTPLITRQINWFGELEMEDLESDKDNLP